MGLSRLKGGEIEIPEGKAESYVVPVSNALPASLCLHHSQRRKPVTRGRRGPDKTIDANGRRWQHQLQVVSMQGRK